MRIDSAETRGYHLTVPLRPIVAMAAVVALLSGSVPARADQPAAANRPRIGVAFGGGSARGLAHVGVIRWFEEHHVPIDLVAGTSMGGLIGGAFASGLSSGELAQLLGETDWDEMFGSTPFRYKNVRRKRDARAYPSRIEFGLKHGIVPPLALNNGQQVNFLLARIVGPYRQLEQLRRSADAVPVSRGRSRLGAVGRARSRLARRRAARDDVAARRVSADGDRRQGAGRRRRDEQRAGERRPHHGRRSRDRGERRLHGRHANGQLLADGPDGPDRRRDDAGEHARRDARRRYRHQPGARGLRQPRLAAQRRARRRRLSGGGGDEGQAAAARARRCRVDRLHGAAAHAPAVAAAIASVPGGGRRRPRRTSGGWSWCSSRTSASRSTSPRSRPTSRPSPGSIATRRSIGSLVERDGQVGLEVRARPKTYAPPFLMLGVSLENTTTSSFSFQLAGPLPRLRRGGFGLRTAGRRGARRDAECRRGAVPADRRVAVLRHRDGAGDQAGARTSSPTTRWSPSTRRARALIGGGGGINIGRDDDVRAADDDRNAEGTRQRRRPGAARARRTRDAQRPRAGRTTARTARSSRRAVCTRTPSITHIFDSPDAPPDFVTDRTNVGLTQFEAGGSAFWPITQARSVVRGRRLRHLVRRPAAPDRAVSARPAAAARRRGVWRGSRRSLRAA